jgi:hypothetical protein
MKRIHRQAWGAVIVLAWATVPAAAQERSWTRDLERHVDAIARHVERLVDDHLDDILDEIDTHADEIQFKVQQKLQALAQRGAGEAARRAAQAAREAERRRREEGRRGPEYTEQISRTLRLGRNGTFDLQNLSGDIVVTGGGGNDVRIEATKRVRHPREPEARALLKVIEVRIEERNGNVEVRTTYPRRNWSGGVDYTVSLPRDANVVLRSISGDIRVSTLNGELRAESMSGNVRATSVRRLRQAKTVSGDLEIAGSDGDEVMGSTMSGTVMARDIKARSVDLQSVSGDLQITDVESERAFVRSVSGNVDFSGRLARKGRYELQSHSGDVRVTPRGVSGFSVEASTFSGNLRSDYPLTLSGPSSNLRRGRGVRGLSGAGGAALVLQSFSGNITIVKQ